MTNSFGLRLEDKDQWERRVVLIPSDVKEITGQGIQVCVERSPQRAFSDESFSNADAELLDDVRNCDLVLGVKEIPAAYFRQDGAYIFFSHTFKGQPYNMKMLAAMVERGAKTLMKPQDTWMYEKMRYCCVDDPFGVRLDVYCPAS